MPLSCTTETSTIEGFISLSQSTQSVNNEHRNGKLKAPSKSKRFYRGHQPYGNMYIRASESDKPSNIRLQMSGFAGGISRCHKKKKQRHQTGNLVKTKQSLAFPMILALRLRRCPVHLSPQLIFQVAPSVPFTIVLTRTFFWLRTILIIPIALFTCCDIRCRQA